MTKKMLFMGGGLLALLLSASNVQAANDIKSSGVLSLQNDSGKKVVFDASDIQKLRDDVDGLKEPEIEVKITYHEHTDSCYEAAHVDRGIYEFLTSDYDPITSWPTADSSTKTAIIRCTGCSSTAPAFRYKSSASEIGQKDYRIGDTHLIYTAYGTSGSFPHQAWCPFYHPEKLICNKDETTIEDVQVILK